MIRNPIITKEDLHIPEVQSFEEFSKRFHSDEPFWACINAEGEWFDSAKYYGVAVHWLFMENGFPSDLSEEDEFERYTNGELKGYAVVHSSMLKPLFESGFLK